MGRQPDFLFLDDERGPVTKARPTSRKLIAFGWYGGKFSHLDWLLPLLPRCEHYVEPFAGSAAVLLNREPSTAETYNDIDGEAVNFFRVLRDEPEALERAIALTPFSREEFFLALGAMDGEAPVERARRFYIRARQARSGLAQVGSLGRWANCNTTVRNRMPGAVSRWFGGVHALGALAARLLRVQFENRPALDVIRAYDAPGTLFYCDPPYVHETRGDSNGYGFEMTDADHAALAVALSDIRGKAAVSGYRCDKMDGWFIGWRRHDGEERTNHATKGVRRECLWMNY